MAQIFFKVDPAYFRIYSQVEEVTRWMQQNNLRISDHGILVFIDYSVIFKQKIMFKQCVHFHYLQQLVEQQQDLGFLMQNRFNLPRLFTNYKFTVTGFRKEKDVKDDVIQMIRAFGGGIVRIQTVEQMKAQLDRRDMNYYIIVYQPKLLLKLLERLPDYQEIIVNKCRSIYALFHVCGEPAGDFNPSQYLDEEFTRLKLLENSCVGISKIPLKASDDRIQFRKIGSHMINKFKYITFRLHSKTSEAEHLLKEEFYMYYKQDIKQFYDLIIPYQLYDGQYKILQNQFPIDAQLSYWSLYLAFSKQVLLCVQNIENIQELKQLIISLLQGSLSQSTFDKQFENFTRYFTLVPFSKANKVPIVLINRCFFVLAGNDQYQVPREFHTRMSNNPINLRNALWLVTIFLQCNSQQQLIEERQSRPTIYKSQSQYSQAPYNSSKQLPFFCCEIRNTIALVLCSNINVFLHEVQMNKNPINADEIINRMYVSSITQQERAIIKAQIIKLLNIDENRADQIQIQSYDDLLQNALANNFQMSLAIQSQQGFDNQGGVVIKQETDSIQNMVFGTFSPGKNSPFVPRSADDLEDDQFGIE